MGVEEKWLHVLENNSINSSVPLESGKLESTFMKKTSLKNLEIVSDVDFHKENSAERHLRQDSKLFLQPMNYSVILEKGHKTSVDRTDRLNCGGVSTSIILSTSSPVKSQQDEMERVQAAQSDSSTHTPTPTSVKAVEHYSEAVGITQGYHHGGVPDFSLGEEIPPSHSPSYNKSELQVIPTRVIGPLGEFHPATEQVSTGEGSMMNSSSPSVSVAAGYPASPPMRDHASRTLLLTGLPRRTKEEDLKAEMESWGPLRYLHLFGHNRQAGNNRPDESTAFVVAFFDLRHAKQALTDIQHQHLLQQQRMHRQLASSSSKGCGDSGPQQQEESSEPQGSTSEDTSGQGLIQGRAIWAQFTVLPGPESGESDSHGYRHNQGTLVVFNLDVELSLEKFREIFTPYGDIKEVRETPAKKQHKFVEFFDVRDASRALSALNGAEVSGKRIKIEFSRPGGGHARKSANQIPPLNQLPVPSNPHWVPHGAFPVVHFNPRNSFPNPFPFHGMGWPNVGPPLFPVGPMGGMPGQCNVFPLHGMGNVQVWVPGMGSVPQNGMYPVPGMLPFQSFDSRFVPGASKSAPRFVAGIGATEESGRRERASPSFGRLSLARQPESSHGTASLEEHAGYREPLPLPSPSTAPHQSSAAVTPENRTTIMIRNIPNKYSQCMLLELLDSHCRQSNEPENLKPNEPLSAYDFVYLPIDFKNRCNLGYAFVNLTSVEATSRIFKSFHGQPWEAFNSRKICEVAYARVQGRAAMEEHFRNSKFACDNSEYLPLTFSPPRDGLLCTPPTLAAGRQSFRSHSYPFGYHGFDSQYFGSN